MSDARVDKDAPDTDSLSTSDSEPSSATNGFKYNDVFKSTGSFKVDGYEVIWKQAGFKDNVKYPKNSKAISIIVKYKNNVVRTPHQSPYLGADGKAVVWVYTPQGKPRRLISAESFHSDKFKTLVKAVNQVKKENEYIRTNRKKGGLKSLPSAIKDHKGEIIATDGTIILNAAIRSIKSHNVAHRKSTVSIRAFDNVNRLLKMDGMGWIVHRMVQHAGLKVNHHPTRGRQLVGGQCSANPQAARGECSTIPAEDLQHGNNRSLVTAAPTPANTVVTTVAQDRFCENEIRDADVTRVVNAVNDIGRSRTAVPSYATDMARYLAGQTHVFATRPSPQQAIRLGIIIADLFYNAYDLRNDVINERAYFRRVNDAIDLMGFIVRPDGMTAANLVNLIQQMPGFQINNALLRTEMRERIVLNMNQRLALVELNQTYNLPDPVMELIYQLARVFAFRIAASCSP